MKTIQVVLALAGVASARFEPLQHLGANSPWFAGPNNNAISAEVPAQCTVDQAFYVVRHGSRYPDPGAYREWTDLHAKASLQSANYTARGDLAFMKSWKPVLEYPDQQIAMLSPGGYRELYTLGSHLRFRYPEFYEYGQPFLLWANDYQRTIDSARLFARGYLGPNSSLADIHVVTASQPSALGNSLATSDQCPTFKDTSGSPKTTTWDAEYLPKIIRRLNRMIEGGFELNATDVPKLPYLCGFETQITGRRSPWCDVFKESEILDYEYRQDLRYYYGTGPGAGNNASVMLPVLQGVVDVLTAGPGVTAKRTNGSDAVLPRLLVAFTHDNQINEVASITGVFDEQRPLNPSRRDDRRIYISSNINPMRGTVTFERLNCDGQINVRVRLNDAVYAVPSCSSGPGSSCPLADYASLVKRRFEAAGQFGQFCNVSQDKVIKSPTGGVTFFTDLTLPAIRVVKPRERWTRRCRAMVWFLRCTPQRRV
ncbi:histidine phosphatase superfamily [Elsinoe ampelina]|uniref:3-phytase n=1 Tax=Elsinoe ampelina TaxID=302913 RepID=A0A6A6G4T7_9PEZI|nr:histidine phosphatase superfamily [Elsinoe ampelina]